jgi:hypothetical protein
MKKIIISLAIAGLLGLTSAASIAKGGGHGHGTHGVHKSKH